MSKGAKEAEKQLLEYGVLQEKILFYKNIVCKNEKYELEFKDNRLALMRMCISVIRERNILGEIAEVGVYKGDLAQYLNKYFPDRKLYLFDTFEGMKGNQEVENITKGKCFSDTSVQIVMDKMRHPDKCIIKKGYFPNSARGIKENFAFVSLDTDLYDSILAGLEFFYPKMSKGGYIFVHDYWPYTWGGVKKAVMEFCNKYSIGYVPINDLCGSVILTK